MAEADRYLFDFKELATAFVKLQDLHEGLWGVCIEFGLGAANVPTGTDGKTITPAAINFVQKIGVQRFPQANNLTVDAAEVNPAPRRRPGGRRATTAGAVARKK
jgi:hypothetical protein